MANAMAGLNEQVFGENKHKHRQILLPVKFIPVDCGIADLVQWMIGNGMSTEYSCQGEDTAGGMLPFVCFDCENAELVEHLRQMLNGFGTIPPSGSNQAKSYRLEFTSVGKLEQFNQTYFGHGLWVQIAFTAGKV